MLFWFVFCKVVDWLVGLLVRRFVECSRVRVRVFVSVWSCLCCLFVGVFVSLFVRVCWFFVCLVDCLAVCLFVGWFA